MTLPGSAEYDGPEFVGSDDDLYINFSDKEASADNVEREPLPSGKYLAMITDVTMEECGPTSKNPGKNYYRIEFTVQESVDKDNEYAGRKCWTNAMLFSGALYTMTKLLKGIGLPVTPGEMRIPKAEWWVGKTFVIGGTLKGEQTDKVDKTKKYPPKFEPDNFFPKNTWDAVKSGSGKPAVASAGNKGLLP